MTADFVCPSCRGELRKAAGGLACEACGIRYGNLSGIPILIAGVDVAVVDRRGAAGELPGHDCRALGIGEIDAAFARGDEILEIGAGRESARAPNLTRTDAFVYDAGSLDAVADAHALPFADGSFDFVFSLAVFEHLHSPWVAAEEIRRVLRVGGRVYILCAFFQQLHGYPDHYFNVTESGLRRLFQDGFEIVGSGPSEFCGPRESVVPLFRMNDMAGEFLRAPEVRPSYRARWRARRLRRALRTAAHQYQQLEPEILGVFGARCAWRTIAPAVELTAQKT